MKPQRRPYQSEFVAGIYGQWNAGHRNVVGVMPTGAGKTKTFASMIDELQGSITIIAHRKELVGQISATVGEFEIPHNIIASEGSIKNCVHRHVAQFGRSFYAKRSRVTVASVDTLLVNMDKLAQWGSEQRFWITDECFPAGTLIDGKPIETIQVGDMVTAFDETDGSFSKRRVVRLFRNPAPPVMVHLCAGKIEISSTVNHPFWTKRGWVKAADVSEKDSVFSERDGWVKVTSVTCELFSDGYVYNIEVDDLHTYIANGIVVHNCHHVLQNNKWGKALALFPAAYGLGVTATPIRADRKSLARSQAGVFDAMVIGPSMRDLIEAGNLCDYVIYAPPLSINLDNLKVGASGEYTGESVRKESHRSQIVGDMVAHYARFAAGKRTIVFAVDVEQSEEIATRFRDAGYRAAAVDGTTPENVRDMTVDKFSRGVLDILVNVDLFGEGFDVPAVECVIMGRPTQSFGLYTQQFGRALRPLTGKPHGIIIDCVGNVGFHGLPDAPRKWSLLSEERGRRRERDPDAVPIKRCLNDACMKAYPATNRACPYCGFIPEPAGRSLPEQVDGDLMMLDAATLAKMRGAVARIDDTPQVPLHLIGTPAEKAIIRNWQERQSAQADLRASIAAWAGVCHAAGDDDPTIHRRFYFRFGTDILTAQTLGVTDAKNLVERIDAARNSQ